MIIIADNFSASTTLLRKEKKVRDKTEDPSEEIENITWKLFYQIGFQTLNIGRECLLSFGKNEASLKTKKIDVIAESDDALVLIECTTQINNTPKIKQWAAEVEEIRKFYTSETIFNEKNIVFVYCTDSQLSNNDEILLNSKGIISLNRSKIEYFQELSAQYDRLAYYQLLGYLCKNKPIKSIPKEQLVVPSIKTKYGDKSFCYLFAIHPSTLIPLATIPHRKRDFEIDLNNNYQRIVKKVKIKGIKDFIRDKRGVFPTNIIVSIEGRSKFEPMGKAINDIQYGSLTLPNNYDSMYVIDGQHRLFAYDGIEQGKKDLIFVVAFEKMALEDQVQTFVDINEKQTKVSASLLWDLYPSILDESDIRYRISILVKKLNTDEGNPLEGLITYDSAPYSSNGPKLTLEAVCTAIKKEKIIEDIEALLILNRVSKSKWDKIILDLLSAVFYVVSKRDVDHWRRKEKTNNFYKSNQAFGSFMKLLDELIKEIHRNHPIDFENSINGELTFIENKIEEYMIPIISRVKQLGNNKEDIKDFKRVGEGGKKQLFDEFVTIIRKSFPDFCSHLKTENASIEIEEILADLKQNGESDILEIKEAFFTDTKRLKATNELQSNKEEAIKGILKTIVAFSNSSNGGRIVIGIEDESWEVKGIEDTDLKLKKNWDTLKTALSNKIKDNITIQKVPIIRKEIHLGRTLAIIDVKPNPKDSFENVNLSAMDNVAYKRINSDTVAIETSKIGSYCKAIVEELESQED